jgi:hypothetical protein
MKYIITESQFDTIKNYINTTFDTIFDIDNIMYEPSDEGEDEWNFYVYKKGEMKMIFTWVENEDKTILKIYGGIGGMLDDEFGDIWKETFKDWFMENFGKPVTLIKY